MQKAILCPSCGAPQSSNPPPAICPFCNCAIESPAQSTLTPATAALDTRSVLLWLGIVGITTLIGGLVTAVRSVRPRTALVAAPVAAPSTKTIALARLRDIPIQMSTEMAKTGIEAAFPEARADAHHKQFDFYVANPIFSRATASWEWGCNCLENIVIVFDWNKWQKARDPVTVCLARVLGEPNKQVPPAVFEWSGNSKMPALGIGWQDVTIRVKRSTSQAEFQREVDALDRCSSQ